MQFKSHCYGAAVLLALAGLAVGQQPGKLAAQLADLNATVVPAGEQKILGGTVADAIQRRRQELNDQQDAAWKKVKDRGDWERFRNSRLEALKATLGQFPPPPKSLNVRITSTVPGDGFRIDNLVFESRPGLWVTANLYRPDKPRDSMPGILICHAHHTPKEHGELQDMGMTWARAGCLVLVMDQLGHGERRQHPFVSAESYPKPYRVSRQDYHFRYDTGVQLHLAGDSLIGWMAWDLMRGVDLLLAQKGIDPKRIILLGAVAGGGDPAAVVGALDERITCVVPFNFGAPSPRPQYPYPLDKEPRWNWAGGGSWESTRNLRRGALDGFMPWVLVASAAPRHLVYAHEFGWFREGDPAWRRLQMIYGFYEAPDRLAFTFGKGDVTKRPPEGTHCTHIGALHRVMIHDAFRRWFQIDVAKEYSERLPPEKLRCWTPEAQRDLKPRKLTDLLAELSAQRLAQARKRQSGDTSEQRKQLQVDWARLLGDVQPREPRERVLASSAAGDTTVERVLLTTEPGIVVPLILLRPRGEKKPPVVVAVSQAGKSAFLRERSADLAALLEAGVAVCLPDLRGTGETGLGTGRGPNSAATSLSSSQLMLGETLVGGQLRDLRAVLQWLRRRTDVDAAKAAVWGDSFAPANASTTNFVVPRDPDHTLPPQSEPLGGLLALLAGLYENGVQAVYARGGLATFRSVFDSHLVLVPHDAVVPGALTAGDVADITAALAPRPVRLDGLVDSLNRRVPEAKAREVYGRSAKLTIQEEPSSPAGWLVAQLQKQ